ncbi:MAG TPA: Arc family DNA-binding protein [Vicinamibacteria bacterium]|nr:Arc family DNA-binding protein [Vicinamibacteria bacterium]
MATVTLKNVPEELVQTLKQIAKQNRRSLNQEALARLESSVAASRRSGGEAVKALRRVHKQLAGLPPLNDDLLNRAKTEGRL